MVQGRLIFPNAIPEAQSEPIPQPDCLEAAGLKLNFNHSQIQEVRLVLRMGPIFLLTIMYWTIYSQMASVWPCTDEFNVHVLIPLTAVMYHVISSGSDRRRDV
jgi:hypothetical protein